MKKLLLLLAFLIGGTISANALTVEGIFINDPQTQKTYAPLYIPEKNVYIPQEIIFNEGAFTPNGEKVEIRELEDETFPKLNNPQEKMVGIFRVPAYKDNRYVSASGLSENWIRTSKHFDNIFQHYVCLFLHNCGHFNGSQIKLDSVQNFFDNKPYKILAVNPIRNDKLTGTVLQYHPNGQLGEKCTYENGVENGPIEQYWENGNIKWKGTYKNGKLNGIDEQFNEQGNLFIQTTYIDNTLKGPFQMYYSNGNIKVEGTYTGEQNLVKNLIIYSEDGKIMEKQDIARFTIQ